MVKINFNEKLFDTHLDKISKSISKLIKNLDKKNLEKSTIKCLEYLSEKKEIENLLKANTFQLELYIEYFKLEYPMSIGNGKKEKDWEELHQILRKEIFEKEYDNWGTRKIYGAYSFVKGLGLETCPYCNRNYTFLVDSENGKLRPEIDHFYPKSIYPFLAMSFYNLIPSCSICNHTKSNKLEKDLENPYDIDNRSYRFTYIPKDIDFLLVKKEKYDFDNFEIKIIDENKNSKYFMKAKRLNWSDTKTKALTLKDFQYQYNMFSMGSNIQLFKLDELYAQHKDVVLELLIKKSYYPRSYIKELSTNFGFTTGDIYRYLLSNYKEDDNLHKRPLSKLVRDIVDELKLLN